MSEEERTNAEEKIDFCLSKCGDGYCPAMKGQSGYPCLEFICEFCTKPGHSDIKYCRFCKGLLLQ
jgi:hypothetical protein